MKKGRKKEMGRFKNLPNLVLVGEKMFGVYRDGMKVMFRGGGVLIVLDFVKRMDGRFSGKEEHPNEKKKKEKRIFLRDRDGQRRSRLHRSREKGEKGENFQTERGFEFSYIMERDGE